MNATAATKKTTKTTTRETTESAFDAAVERATRLNVRVCGLGRFKEHPTRRFAIVNSASRPGTYHVVSISDVRLCCDCEAAQRGCRVCVHVAATSMYLTARAARQRRFEEAVEEALREERIAATLAETAAITADTQASIRELRARQATWAQEAKERDSAFLDRSPKPISPFATVAPRPARPPLRPIRAVLTSGDDHYDRLGNHGATPRSREEW